MIGYHVTFSEGHMIANHPIWGHNYSYHIRGGRSPLICRSDIVSKQEKYIYLHRWLSGNITHTQPKLYFADVLMILINISSPWVWKGRHLGYERVYLSFYKVADTLFHIQGDDISNEWGFRPPLLIYRLNWDRRTSREFRWHCPLDIEFEILALAVWGRARHGGSS